MTGPSPGSGQPAARRTRAVKAVVAYEGRTAIHAPCCVSYGEYLSRGRIPIKWQGALVRTAFGRVMSWRNAACHVCGKYLGVSHSPP